MTKVSTAAVCAAILGAGAWAYGQQQTQPYRPTPPPPPNVRTGADIGFRVNTMSRDGKAVGKLMVRMPNGDWVEADILMDRGTHLLPLGK